MGEHKLLIVGVDPGTTLGYAAIDFDGNVVEIRSERNIDLSSLITELIRKGKPIILATDKQKNPDIVDKLGAKLGAKIISPDYDLKVEEKRLLAKGFDTKNQHEIDALASALFALRKLSPLLKKISIFVEHYNKGHIKQQLIEFVVGKELNIKDAAEIIEEPEKEESQLIMDVVEKKQPTERSFIQLYKRYKQAKKEAEMLRQQNTKLQEQFTALRRDYEYMFRQISRSQLDKKMQSLLDFKERRINYFENEIKKKGQQANEMQGEITTLLYFLAHYNECIFLKKLDNLGTAEYEKKESILNIGKGDVLLVKDPDIVSGKLIERLKDKVNVIFYRKQISKKIEAELPFIFINAREASIEENEYFAVMDKISYEKIVKKKTLLDQVVQAYQKEKSS